MQKNSRNAGAGSKNRNNGYGKCSEKLSGTKTPGKIPYLGVVHRLDQPVEGILVFAKTSEAAGNLSKQMMAGGAGKYYLAVTEGKAKSSEGTLTDYLKKMEKPTCLRWCLPIHREQKAILHYKVLDQQEINGKSRTLLKIRLKQVGIIRSVCSSLMRTAPSWRPEI